MSETQQTALKKLHFGCGGSAAPGWINSDINDEPGIDVICNMLEGFPLEDGSIDYAVGIHVLPELAYPDLEPALVELRRILRDGGVLRLALPDLERAMRAYIERDAGYFLVPDDDVRSLGGKMVVQLTWYGYSKSMYTFDFIEEMLYRAGFRQVERCSYKQTASAYADIVELDNRENESLFVEAVK